MARVFAGYAGAVACASLVGCSAPDGSHGEIADPEAPGVRALQEPLLDANECGPTNYDACEGDDLHFFNAASVDPYHGVDGTLYTWLVGDVNGDERDDLIRRHADGADNKVFLSMGDGSFSPQTPPIWNGSSNVTDNLSGNNLAGTASWFAADVNGDGRTDLVRRDPGGANKVLLSRLGTQNRFDLVTATDGLTGVHGFSVSWHVGDFDGDGDDDLVRRAADPSKARVLLSVGNGRFEVLPSRDSLGAPDSYAGYDGDGSYLWLVGDFNGDGRDDLMRRSESGTGNVLMLSRYRRPLPGDDRFTVFANIDTYSGGYDTRRWFVGDLDGDGDDDLIRRDHGGTYNKVMFSKGDGTFRTATPRHEDGTSEIIGGVGDTSGFEWHSGDFDGDGRMDMVRRSNDGAGNLVILSRYRNNGVDGHEVVISATDSAGFVSGTQHTWLTADLNGDRHTDLVRRNRIGEDNRALVASFASQEVIYRPSESCDISKFPGEGATREYAHFRVPALVTAADGTLLAFSEGRDGIGDFGDIDVVLKRSTDRGATWSGCEVVCNGIPDDTSDVAVCGNPTPVVDAETGKVWLFMNHEPHDAKADGVESYGERQVWLSMSADHGRSWSLPEDRTSDLLPQSYWDSRKNATLDRGWDSIGPGRGIQLVRGPRKGRLIVPAEFRNIYSDDHGETWQVELRTQAKQEEGIQTGFTGESSIVELSTGWLMRNDRPLKVVYEGTDSVPGIKRRMVARAIPTLFAPGWRWSNFAADPVLLDPNCEASILDLSDANKPQRLVFLNSASTLTRRKMLLRVSNDDGLSWPLYRDLYPELPLDSQGRTRGGYSIMTVIDRQTIGVLADFNELEEEARSLVFRRLNLTWIARGPSNY